MRAPTVRRGQAVTAALWNQLAGAVNEGRASPRDKDAGITAGEGGAVTRQELSRTTETVRVTSPDDPEVYVEVARFTSITYRNSATGATETDYIKSP